MTKEENYQKIALNWLEKNLPDNKQSLDEIDQTKLTTKQKIELNLLIDIYFILF